MGMTRKRFVTKSKDGTAHVFHPAITEDEVTQPLIRTLLQNLFRGDPTKVVQALLDGTEVSEDELAEIEKLIKDASLKAKGESK